MSAIVKLGTASNTGGPLGITNAGKDSVLPTKDYMGVRLSDVTMVKIGGKDHGGVITDNIIEARQTVLIRPAVEMLPRKYQILVSYNPLLLKYGIVSCPPIIAPSEVNNLSLQFTALKKIDLSDLEYFYELYMID